MNNEYDAGTDTLLGRTFAIGRCRLPPLRVCGPVDFVVISFWPESNGAACVRCQMPAYHAYPPSGDAEPNPLPNCLMLSVRVSRVMYLTFL